MKFGSGPSGSVNGLFFEFGFRFSWGASAPVNPWSKPGLYPDNVNGFRFGCGAFDPANPWSKSGLYPDNVNDFRFGCGAYPDIVNGFRFGCGAYPDTVNGFRFGCGADPDTVNGFRFGCGASASVDPWSKPGLYADNGVNDGIDCSINGFGPVVDDTGFGTGACATFVDAWPGPGGALVLSDSCVPDDSTGLPIALKYSSSSFSKSLSPRFLDTVITSLGICTS